MVFIGNGFNSIATLNDLQDLVLWLRSVIGRRSFVRSKYRSLQIDDRLSLITDNWSLITNKRSSIEDYIFRFNYE